MTIFNTVKAGIIKPGGFVRQAMVHNYEFRVMR